MAAERAKEERMKPRYGYEGPTLSTIYSQLQQRNETYRKEIARPQIHQIWAYPSAVPKPQEIDNVPWEQCTPTQLYLNKDTWKLQHYEPRLLTGKALLWIRRGSHKVCIPITDWIEVGIEEQDGYKWLIEMNEAFNPSNGFNLFGDGTKVDSPYQILYRTKKW
jgi:hypothetical protein